MAVVYTFLGDYNLGANADNPEALRFLQEVAAIIKETERAKTLFPSWPTNQIEAVATVVEEAGEAIQVALNMRPSDPHCGGPKGTLEALRAELVQTAAMAIRALMHLPEEK